MRRTGRRLSINSINSWRFCGLGVWGCLVGRKGKVTTSVFGETVWGSLVGLSVGTRSVSISNKGVPVWGSLVGLSVGWGSNVSNPALGVNLPIRFSGTSLLSLPWFLLRRSGTGNIVVLALVV